MTSQEKKYVIKIPADTSVIYCNKKRILTFLGPLQQKSIKLKLKILFNAQKKILKVSSLTFLPLSNYEKRKIKVIRGTTVALIKHLLMETSILISQKLQLHGMGYRVFPADILTSRALVFKLGHSHRIFIKMSVELSAFCFSRTRLCVAGFSYQEVTQMSALIRSCRNPEPYKGKGVLYNNEKVVLKEGKKVKKV